MPSRLVNSSVVVVANDVNLSIFKPPWLLRNGILLEAELEGEILLSPVTVQVPTEHFVLGVMPNRIQLELPREYEKAGQDVQRVVGGIVRTLPHTPYNAVGINFHYEVDPPGSEPFAAWNRRVCASPLAERIAPAGDGARYGFYVSFDAMDARLKMDVKPITRKQSGPDAREQAAEEHLAVNMNFHRDLIDPNSVVDDLVTALDARSQALAMSQDIASAWDG